ncbi:hypothetical protein Ccrd_013827 [Cynara cardunculus var. scolymus]|uniref:Homologous recombination OB-fold protein OB-fold domain-containing protein n=2 Tax=Cynara cardunculus var. scolymus TaxID=59895 RepID=A0A103YEW1_CYNCS|nr:hypothetical protein Ccrd_013827 [Cynara cardunculus var. scolymus]
MELSWEEALDVDDSDLRSLTLLRPCKQQRRRDETNPPTTTDLPLSQTLDFSHSPSQTDNSLPRNFNSVCQYEAPPPSRVIPGPAGIVQAAKLLKTRDNGRFLGQEEPMATQGYIRRVVEDPEEDADFKCSPWLSAMEFFGGDGMFNSVPSAHLGDIKRYLKNGKLDQVVAVVKSCAPNALGDLMVVLKDPTGTVSGTIHHKVLTEGEFGKGSFVGSVLVLHKVSVFSPSRSANYLNITKRNLVKVFYKDGGPSQTSHGCRTIDAAPSSDSVRRTTMLHGAFSQEPRAEGIANGTKTNAKSKPSLHIGDDQENTNPIVSTGHHMIATDNEILKETDVIGSGENEHRAFDNCKQPTEGGGHKCGSNFVNDGNKNGVKGRDAVRVHVEPAKANGSLPVWTDEQLNELFDVDFQDDMSF